MLAPVFYFFAINQKSAGRQMAMRPRNPRERSTAFSAKSQDAAAVTSRGDFRRSTTTR